MLVHPLEPCQRRSGKAPSCTDVGQCGLLWKGTYCPLSPAQENPAQHNIAEGVGRHLLIHSSAGHASNAGIISSALLGNHSTKKRRTWPWLHKLFHICLPLRCLLFFFLPPGRKVLIIYAHQEPKSLNGSLKRVAVEELSRQGCTVTVSDLYAMQFEPRATRNDIVGKSSQNTFFFFFQTDFNLIYPAALASQNPCCQVHSEKQLLLFCTNIPQDPVFLFSVGTDQEMPVQEHNYHLFLNKSDEKQLLNQREKTRVVQTCKTVLLLDQNE